MTGAGGGIGEASAALFWEQGAAVVLVDNHAEDVANATRAIDPSGARLLELVADVSSEPAAQKVVQATVERFGRLDVLANVAGVRAPVRPITQASVEDWQRVLGVNLIGMALCCKFAIPEMHRSGGGSIINVSSVGAQKARSGWAMYDASKAAVIALTRDMACDHAAQGIRVNAVCPGFVLTRFHIRNWARENETSYEAAESAMRTRPYPRNILGRHAEPRELAFALLFLASDESSFATGAVFNIDGGHIEGA